MRWWPIRARRFGAPPPPEDLLVAEDRVRRNVEDVLVVGDRQTRGGVIVFRGVLTTEPRRALDLLIERFRPLGYTPFLRQEADVVAVQAWPLAETTVPWRIGVNVLLFVATCLSTLVAGPSFAGSPTVEALRAGPPAAPVPARTAVALALVASLSLPALCHHLPRPDYPARVGPT